MDPIEWLQFAIFMLCGVVVLLTCYVLTIPESSLPWWFQAKPKDEGYCPLHRSPPSHCARYHKDE